jgi:hypothetical protein
MNPDFSQLNIFWGCNNQDNIVELENTLPNVGYSLRHELSQLRVVGVVPRILFIKGIDYWGLFHKATITILQVQLPVAIKI